MHRHVQQRTGHRRTHTCTATPGEESPTAVREWLQTGRVPRKAFERKGLTQLEITALAEWLVQRTAALAEHGGEKGAKSQKTLCMQSALATFHFERLKGLKIFWIPVRLKLPGPGLLLCFIPTVSIETTTAIGEIVLFFGKLPLEDNYYKQQMCGQVCFVF